MTIDGASLEPLVPLSEEHIPSFSDEDIYETIEELQSAAIMAEQEPVEALFSDTAAMVIFLMRERDQAKSDQYNLSMELVRLNVAFEDDKQAAKEEADEAVNLKNELVAALTELVDYYSVDMPSARLQTALDVVAKAEGW